MKAHPEEEDESLSFEDAILNEPNQAVKAVGMLFLQLGFEPLAHNKRITGIGEIDLAFKLQRNGFIISFIVEVSADRTDQNQKIGHFFSKWEAQTHLGPLLSELGVPGASNVRVYVDMSRKRFNPSADVRSIQHHLSNHTKNRILFKDDIEYFSEIFSSIGTWAKSDLLSFLQIPMSQTAQKVEAVQFYLENIPAFCFVTDVRTLLDACYISRRLGNQKGYQRALNQERIKGIGREIQDRKIIAFPNSLIINCEEDLLDHPAQRQDCPKIVSIGLPTSYCSCIVVDGQHRLLGFSNTSETELAQRHLPVVAFQRLPHDQEVRLFADINSKQKRINSNLIEDLKADFDWNPKTNPREHTGKLIVLIARQISEFGPLKGKIYFGGAREDRKGKITLSTFVSVFRDEQLVGGKYHFWQPDSMSSSISEPLERTKSFFGSLLRIFNNRETSREFLLGNVGLRILFRTTQVLERNQRAGSSTISETQFLEDLREVLNDGLISELQVLYGLGGKIEGSRKIISELKRTFPQKYESIQMDFRYHIMGGLEIIRGS